MLKTQRKRANTEINVIKSFLLITLYSSLMPTCLLKTKMVHGKHFVIHVPMKIRTHHHTHTVYTQVHGKDSGGGGSGGGHGGGSKQTIYKIMGYTTHHMAGAGGGGNSGNAVGGGKVNGGHHHHHHRHHGHSHGYRHNRGGDSTDYGEINYNDDYIDCDETPPPYANGLGGGGGGVGGGGGGDMVFNHFSRQDEEDYPDIEEVIDDEMGDEWE